MLLHPLKNPVPPALAARGRAILGILDEIPHDEALNLAFRTLVGILLAARPRFEETFRDQACHSNLGQHVELWVKRELKRLRFCDTKGRLVG